MTRLRIIAGVAALLLMGCKTKETNCKQYFTGTWIYEKYPKTQIYAVRTLSKQLEYTENGKYFYEFDIKWVSDCKYQLLYKGTTSSTPAAAKIGEVTTVDILKINQDEMTYQTVFKNLKEVGNMKKEN
jgi:hypothetical protein